MSISCDNINPNMKFQRPELGVVDSPNLRRYSVREDLNTQEQYYRDFLKSIDKKRRASFAEKHPTLSKNISDLMKLSTLIGAGILAFRYRHSLPLVKNICRNPKKAPPRFMDDLKSFWNKLIK